MLPSFKIPWKINLCSIFHFLSGSMWFILGGENAKKQQRKSQCSDMSWRNSETDLITVITFSATTPSSRRPKSKLCEAAFSKLLLMPLPPIFLRSCGEGSGILRDSKKCWIWDQKLYQKTLNQCQCHSITDPKWFKMDFHPILLNSLNKSNTLQVLCTRLELVYGVGIHNTCTRYHHMPLYTCNK